MVQKRWILGGLVVVYAALYLLPLGHRELIIPDETRYGEIPREMIANGDWIVPRLNGLRYFEKPVMGYWIHALSLLAFGENEFAVRFPCALAAGLTALIIYFVVAHAYGRGEDAIWPAALSAFIYLTTAAVFGIGVSAVLDNLLCLFLTASIAAFYFATESTTGTWRERSWLIASGVACGCAFQTKGFLVFAVVVIVLVPYLAWQRRYRDVFRMSWLPILSAAAVSLPWGVAVHLREPDYWHYFFWVEHIKRFFSDEAHNATGAWFYFVLGPVLAIPWAVVAPAAWAGGRSLLRETDGRGALMKLAICWLVFPFLFFSASSGKLLTYILPCFPAFAILMGCGLLESFRLGRTAAFRRGIVAAGGIAVVLAIALIGVETFGGEDVAQYASVWKPALAVVALAVLAGGMALAHRHVPERRSIALFGLACVPMFVAAHFIVPDMVNERESPGPFLRKHTAEIGPDTVVISDGGMVRAACWYFKRDDVYMMDINEFTYGLSYPDAEGRLLDWDSGPALIEANRGNIVLVARNKSIRRWLREALPEPVYEDSSGYDGFVFWKW